jgi:hypothetical protein
MSFELLLSRGRPDYAVSADPAANAEASITVPSGSTWVILAAHLTVVQGATQTPLPSLVITTTAAQGSVVIGTYAGASAAMSASTTSTFDWYEGAALTAGAGATSNRASIPRGLSVKPGWIISTSTAGKGANTDLSVLSLHIVAL